MALIDELSDALKEAMKAKDKPKLDAIRQVQTEIAKKKSENLSLTLLVIPYFQIVLQNRH